jgi:hypothetical protein
MILVACVVAVGLSGSNLSNINLNNSNFARLSESRDSTKLNSIKWGVLLLVFEWFHLFLGEKMEARLSLEDCFGNFR